MIEEIKNLQKLLEHLKILFETFEEDNSYKEIVYILEEINNELDYITTLYKSKGKKGELKERQMVLADIIEFIIFGRLSYYMQKHKMEGRKKFIEFLLYFVNLLMEIDSLTVNIQYRKKFLEKIKDKQLIFSKKDLMLYLWHHPIGLPEKDLKEYIKKVFKKTEKFLKTIKKLNNIYDSLLPKTAGGLWHEIGVYAFMLRLDLGYIFPLLIHQRVFSLSDYLVVPDFLLLTHDKRFYGIEVGNKKEIQTGLFSAKTAIPTITIDTNSSRLSDRCPICKKWIQICPYAIKKFVNFNSNSLINGKFEIKCLDECNMYTQEEIVSGKCPYAKYSQGRGSGRNLYNNHDYADGKHYHYKCIIKDFKHKKNFAILNDIKQKGFKAIKTHLPYYSGLEGLYKND